MRREPRKILLGIKEQDGKEVFTRAGVLRISKTTFISAWLVINTVRLYLSNSFDLIYNPAYQTAIITTFFMIWSYYKTKDKMIKQVKEEGFLYEGEN